MNEMDEKNKNLGKFFQARWPREKDFPTKMVTPTTFPCGDGHDSPWREGD
jgi:hypothetical protein